MLITALFLLQQIPDLQLPLAQRAVPPRFAGVYRVAEGRLDRTGAGGRGATEVIFNNTVRSNYFSFVGIDQEWTDNGILLDRNAAAVDQISGFEFLYCSSEADAHGNAGTITISFYDEYLACAGPTFSGATCSYDLSGLPLGDPTGQVQCWSLTVDLEGVECDTGPTFRTTGVLGQQFSWGFRGHETLTGPWLSSGGLGNEDWFEWFDATNADGRPLDATDPIIGCFWFSGAPYAGFDMKLFGPSEGAWRRRADPPNALGVDFTTDPIAGTATWTLTDAPTPGLCYWLVLSATPAWVEYADGTLLLDPRFARIRGFLPGTTSVTHAIPASVPMGAFSQVIATTGGDAEDPVEFSDAWLHN